MRAAVVAALLACLVHDAGSQLPDTPAGRQLAGWLGAFNSSDRDTLRHFLDANASPAGTGLLKPGPGTSSFRAQTGGFEFKKAEESTPTHLSALMQERASDQVARLIIEVDTAEPHRITALSLNAVPRPPELAIARLSESALVDALDTQLARDAAAGTFAGAVLVAHNGHSVFERAYGLADRERRISNTLDTRFRIGSMNKMFTAVAILQLVEAEKIRLDAPLGIYLTDYPNKDVAKVTIHQLLTHTGGTGDIFGPQFDANRLKLRTIQDYVDLYGARAPAFEPGAKFDYSNYGFILLGAVIEKVTGMSYYDYVTANIYDPAGMASTGSVPEDSVVANRSVGYMRAEPGSTTLTSNAATLPYRGSSAGGGYSTVRDLSRFATALLDHRLLSTYFTDLVTTGKVDAGAAKYAYGFQDRTVDGVRFFGHGGGAPGMNGELEIDPRTGYVTVALSNLDPPAAQRVVQFVVNRLPASTTTP
jgi:D-alanyl-D-alanine carboxypeptidase